MKNRNKTKINLMFMIIILGLIIGLSIYIYNMKSNINDNSVTNNAQENAINDNPIIDEIIEHPEDKPVSKEIEYKNGAYYIDDVLIVNKTYALAEDFRPSTALETTNYCNKCLEQEVLSAYNQMETDAALLGLKLVLSSGYRSYSYQEKLYTNYSVSYGSVAADTFSARPGHSEHQTGLAFDLNTVSDSFAYTNEGKWVNENAYLYGLIIRYPMGKEEITGYKYEPWHLRYVGKDLAMELYNDGDWLTLEEYFNLTSKYE